MSVSVLLTLLSGVRSATAAPPEPLERVLNQPIIERTTTAEEVRRYIVAHVADVPRFAEVDAWEKYAEQLRRDVLDCVVFRGRAAEWRDAESQVVWLPESLAGPGYRIRKLRFEALPGLWIPALLYEPTTPAERAPVVLNVNGHDPLGKAVPYKQLRSINLAKRGMLVLDIEWFGMGQLKTPGFVHYKLNQIDLCGTSGLAPFHLAMSRGLDILLGHERADPARVAVAGLSGGGWQTILIGALDTRVTLANPVAGYSSLKTAVLNEDFGDSEQSPCDLATVADYAHLTALRSPRPTLLTYNAADDCCFRAGHALEPLMKAARPAFELYGRGDRLRSHVNHDPGTHNFDIDNRQAFYEMLGDFFYAGDEEFARTEIPSEDELRTADELFVPLPEANLDFNAIAQRLSENLPRDAELPGEAQVAARWRQQKRARLREIVRAETFMARAERIDNIVDEAANAKSWRLQLDETWSVPIVELRPTAKRANEKSQTTILIADAGRAAALEHVERLLDEGRRVLAVDLFYFGEAGIYGGDTACTYALMLDAVGRRPLGLQASQLVAVSHWARERGDENVEIEAHGPRSSTIAAVAAALEPQAISRLTLHQPMGSLREPIEENRGADEMPEMFCFGLLAQFDMPQILALVAPRRVALCELSTRSRAGLIDWIDWCGRLGYPIQSD